MKNETQMKAAALLNDKRLYIFDMDGTIYLGGRPFAYAIRFITHLRESKRRVLFFTNNASHNPAFYYDKLARLGFAPREGEIMTSGDVTAVFLNRYRAGRRVYLVGTPELEDAFRQARISLIGEHEASADIVVTSFDTTLTYDKLEAACRYIRHGAEYFCTHPDFNCPTEDGFIPDSGAIAAFVTASTNIVPTYFGKPYPETVEMIAECTGEQKQNMCIFGDRLYTDIATGRRHGITAVLVLSGETTAVDVEQAAEADRPDLVLRDLSEADEIMFS